MSANLLSYCHNIFEYVGKILYFAVKCTSCFKGIGKTEKHAADPIICEQIYLILEGLWKVEVVNQYSLIKSWQNFPVKGEIYTQRTPKLLALYVD